MKDTSYPSLRRATQQDARDLAKLIDIAGEGIPSWLWHQNTTGSQSPLEVGIARARRTTGGFSYTNAVVLEDAGQVLGMALTYPIDAAPETKISELPDPIKPFVELEALSTGTWFVNALATYPAYRNQGLGTSLLVGVEEQARQAGYKEISIQVYGQNTGALRLYKRLGFEPVAQAAVRHHACQPYYTGDVILLIRKIDERSG